MILRYEVTVEVTNENFDKYGIGGIRNAITDAIEKHPFTKATYSANVYEESRFSKDLQEFANAKIAVHIKNREEYNQFMTALYKNGYDISNPFDFQMDDYDPKYPYFYIEAPVARYMNANAEFENIEKYRMLGIVQSTNITLKEVSELDFCQEKEEEMELE